MTSRDHLLRCFLAALILASAVAGAFTTVAPPGSAWRVVGAP